MPPTTRRQPVVLLALAGSMLASALSAQAPQSSPPAMPQRVAEMQHHFVDVTVVHEALIRGDLQATLQPAGRLSTLPNPAGMSGESLRFVEQIRLAGRRIVQAPTLENAIVEAARMLRQCGACHQAMSVFPAVRPQARPDLGGIVGHMLEHQRALDELLLGLVVPSDARWQAGAGQLKRAALRPDHWLPVAELTAELRRADDRVHALADEAARARTALERAPVYSRLLLTCASCHGRHARIWGPRSQ